MATVSQLNVDPNIRDKKAMISCECGCKLFKIVTYERFPEDPYLECMMCENAYSATDEIAKLIGLT